MTTTCDLNVDWNRCAYCSELRDCVQSASDLRLACSQRLDRAWEEYRAERERGNVAFGTVTHRAWQARIDNLDRQLLAADAAAGEAIDEWADCIHEHHRLHEARQQEAEDSSKDVAAGTEEMVTISKAEAVDELVNIYGGHIDKWLEALRERTHAQTDADTEPTAAERDAYFEARDHADDADTPGAPGRRAAVRIVAYDVHKGGCHEADPTDVPVWLLDTPNTAIARDVRQATLQEIRTLIDDLIDGPGERGEGES